MQGMRLVVGGGGPLRDAVRGDAVLRRVVGRDLREDHGPQERPGVSRGRASQQLGSGHHQGIPHRQVSSSNDSFLHSSATFVLA